jgi:phage repressor protein C with HTH and peptisase S24 domain
MPRKLSPTRLAALRIVAEAGPDGVSVGRIHRSPEFAEASSDSLRAILSRLARKDQAVQRVSQGLYAVTEKGRALLREHDPSAADPGAADPGAGAGVEAAHVRVLVEYDLVANAGGDNGRTYDAADTTAVGHYVLDGRELEGIADGEAFVVRVYGRSMVPDFQPGDRVVCRRYTGGWDELSDGHYLIRVDGVAFVKSLQRLPGRRIRIVSANADAFPPYEIDLAAVVDDALDIEPLAVVFGHFKHYWR